MMSRVRALWTAPSASPAPPRRVWRDWVLVAVLPIVIVLEALARPEVAGRWLWSIVLVMLVTTLLWRRTHPLTVLVIAFLFGTVMSLVVGAEPELFSTAYFLILVYALMRWGSGRAVVIGGAILLCGTALSFFTSSPTPADVVGGLAVLVATSTLGITFRWRANARAREFDRMRLLERERLARDLHDTVAHHVSAIAIQAQAGTAVASDDPAAAAAVLGVIETEASHTLAEMRSMVRLLREEGEHADRAPTPGIADITRLARADGALPIVVRIEGDPASVSPTVAAAAFRIAQEAVTNAGRHAHNATRVDVHVRIEPASVRVDVADDGEPAASIGTGYGVTGMTERAALLGGTCVAGPTQRGWAVTATLPRTARPV